VRSRFSESVLLLTVEETRRSIITAREWISSAPDRGPFADLSAEADVYEQMIDDWVAYLRSVSVRHVPRMV
jgi:hypothetical protein